MLTRFLLIVVTTITWIIPISIQAHQSSLHKRHNDEVHKVKVDQNFASRYVVGRRYSSKESHLPPVFYHEDIPHSAVTPPKKLAFDVILRKLEELVALVKMILRRSFDRDEKDKRQNLRNILYKVEDPKPGEVVPGKWWLGQARNTESNEKYNTDSAATEIIRTRIPYEEDHISLVKRIQA